MTLAGMDDTLIVPLHSLKPWRSLSLFVSIADQAGGGGDSTIDMTGELRFLPTVTLQNVTAVWFNDTTASASVVNTAPQIGSTGTVADMTKMYRPNINGAGAGNVKEQLLPGPYLALTFAHAGTAYKAGTMLPRS